MQSPHVPGPRARTAYVVGTVDTKGEELRYLRQLLIEAGVEVQLVDVSTEKGDRGADISNAEVAAQHPGGAEAVFVTDRGEAITAMSEAFASFLTNRSDVGGAIGLGGSGGSAIVAPALQRLPIGLPKILVSTMAGSDVRAYVGTSDLQMMNPVTDLAGLNRVTRILLANAAHALAGMIQRAAPPSNDLKPALGLTMYGVTTPCLGHVTALLREHYDCLVFHATDTGGRSLESLLEAGLLAGFIDVTTSDVPDLLFGGVFAASFDRLGAVIRSRLPYVGSCGALDMINFRALETVPAHFQGRVMHRHNAFITLVRTSPEENAKIGNWIGERLNRCGGPVRFLIPEKGVSKLDCPGAPFYDPEADQALFAAIEATVKASEHRQVRRLPYHINDPLFAEALADSFLEIRKE